MKDFLWMHIARACKCQLMSVLTVRGREVTQKCIAQHFCVQFRFTLMSRFSLTLHISLTMEVKKKKKGLFPPVLSRLYNPGTQFDAKTRI